MAVERAGRRQFGRPTWLLRLLAGRFSHHPERYLQIYRIARKYQLHRLASQVELAHRYEEAGRKLVGDEAHDRSAEQVASALEELGPCFIKLGQLLSTRPDLLPASYIQAMSRLQDRITPVPFAQVAEIVEDELGAPLTDIFASFQPQPLATASIGQVHAAVLRNGEEVVVKVQRPGVRE